MRVLLCVSGGRPNVSQQQQAWPYSFSDSELRAKVQKDLDQGVPRSKWLHFCRSCGFYGRRHHIFLHFEREHRELPALDKLSHCRILDDVSAYYTHIKGLHASKLHAKPRSLLAEASKPMPRLLSEIAVLDFGSKFTRKEAVLHLRQQYEERLNQQQQHIAFLESNASNT